MIPLTLLSAESLSLLLGTGLWLLSSLVIVLTPPRPGP